MAAPNRSHTSQTNTDQPPRLYAQPHSGFALSDKLVALPLTSQPKPSQQPKPANTAQTSPVMRAPRFDSIALRDHQRAISRLEHIEQHIRLTQSEIRHPQWLEEYIDLGLELAQQAAERELRPLQESWLKRIYTTLRDTAFDAAFPENWRQQCGERLYQPFFALQHFYRDPAWKNQAQAKQRMRLLFNDLSMLSRYVV